MLRIVKALLLALSLASWLAFCGAAQATSPLAGSVIENVARATYFDTDNGFHASITSNPVRVIVQPREALTLSNDNAVPRPAGGVVALAHRLTNTGNTSSSYVLAFANRSDDDFDLLSLTLVWDRNGNGAADPGEPALVSGAAFGPLAPGDSADLVLTGTVPTGLAADRVARVELSAKTVGQGTNAVNVDSVTVADGALLQVFQSASNLSPKPGDSVVFRLTASNTGNKAVSGLPVTVDGTSVSLSLLRDVIPANTTLAALGPAGNALALYHLQGQPEHSYSSTPPADLRQVDAVAFGFVALIVPGESLTRSLEVKLNANASGTVTNTARLSFMDGVHAAPVATDSNPVRLTVPDVPPSLRLFGDAQYTRPLAVLSAGQPLYVAVDAAQCNTDPLRVETHLITITSQLSGDIESFLATETSANSGVYHIEPQVPTRAADTTPVARGDGLLTVKPNDRLTVSMAGCGATLMEVSALVDPFGVVFDSKTSLLIAGAAVTLFDVTGAGNGGIAGGPARVFLADGVTRAPSAVTTGADGHFQFPLVAPSVYRLRVVPPASYSFPSALAPSLLPPERVVDAAGSYGSTFTITALSEPLHLDIPVDASPRSGFFIEKTAARKTVELGETLDYSIKIKNVSGQLLGRIRLTDWLPAGFAYQPGSARLDTGTTRLNHSTLPEPEGGVGPVLVFNLGSIDDQAVLTLSYRVRVGPGALQGDGVNRAQATTAAPLAKISNESSATVQVLAGLFSDRGFLIGSVYADCNGDGERNADEPGVPGVRLFLEDGSHVTTDGQGRYSLYGLRPLTHVLKVDRTSLPAGAGALAVLANRNAGDAGSRFIDMKNGDLHKADFAISGCNAELRAAVEARTQALAAPNERSEGAQAAQLAADPRVLPVLDPKSRPASGVIGAIGVAGNATSGAAAAPRADRGRGATAPAATLTDEQIAALDNSLAILTPVDAAVLGYAQTSVTVKGALDATLALSVNGIELPASRIGKLSRLESRQLQVAEYVGVDLTPGVNRLELTQTDPFGIARGNVAVSVTAPGVLARLRLTAPATPLPADGRSVVRITLETLDAAGIAVTARTAVTLDSSLGSWKLRDLNPDEAGVQIFVEGGRAELELESPSESGDAALSAASGSISTRSTLNFVPELRPLIVAGLVEGVLGLRRLDTKALQPVRAQDGFEQELRNLSASFDNGRGTAGARAAMFLKGKVSGDYLLTLAYDSDKDTKERLFRDIQPGEFYPVYGDASVKGFDAQSTSRAYVRIDHGKSHVLHGDFNTQTVGPATGPSSLSTDEKGSAKSAAGATLADERRLGQYSRSLTGVKAHAESADGRAAVTTFASHSSSRQVIDEVPARGVSGPYALSRSALVANSEKVEILTRDRNQPASVLRTQVLSRFADYAVDGLGGRILLKAPLPSLDEGFNPNSLRITYEVDAGGESFWVGGVNARAQLSDQLTVGATLVRDTDPQSPRTLQNAGGTLRLGEHTVAVAEIAQTDTPLAEHTRGMAGRIEIKHDDARLQAQVHVVKAGVGFDNPSASVTKGREEASAKATYKAAVDTTLKAEVLRSQDTTTQASRVGAKIGVEQAFSDKIRGEIGLRYSHAEGLPVNGLGAAAPVVGAAPAVGAEANPHDAASVLVKVTGQLPMLPQASVFGEYEQDIDHAERRVAAIGGEYRLGNGSRLYGRHEFIASLGNRYGLNDGQQRNATVVGIQSDTLKEGNLFSEYRLRDALSGREAEAAVGLRNRWSLGPGLSLSTGYERVRSLNGNAAAESSAVTGGIEYTGARDWKGAARLELRNSSASNTLLGTVGAAYKLSEEWTALGKNVLSVAKNRSSPDKLEDWLQFGLAYREADLNRLNSLVRAEYRWENVSENPAAGQSASVVPDSQRNIGIVSGHLNYQPNGRLLLSGRVAAKWAIERSLGLNSRSNTQLLGARATYDVTREWDVGVQAGALISPGANARQLGLGLEVGHLLTENLWLSAGWNAFGFTDKDLTMQDYTNTGVYLRLRWKFDENLFRQTAQ